MTTLLWFRQDLRLRDNPALVVAAKRGLVVPIYVLDDETAGKWALGGASRWWLHHSVASLARDFAAHGIPLILRWGNAADIIPHAARDVGADAVMWNRCYEPYAIARDSMLKAQLKEAGVHVESFNASLLHEPWEVSNKSGGYFKVFTPFWKHCLSLPEPLPPLPTPALSPVSLQVASERLDDWGLLPSTPDWAEGLRESWVVGEAGAHARLQDFLHAGLAHYSTGRDFPAQPYTSKLSPHLHFGEISPQQIWDACARIDVPDKAKFLAEIGWREFSYHLLYHFPQLPTEPFRADFADFPWVEDTQHLAAWQRGATGYPLVDAGMRELWHTGTMHNRVRMVVASFLTKHLRMHWSHGAAWFWDTLVDADLASNSASWQWVAGCGADAAPYFRIFNPMTQSEKFDASGDYIRRWVPELRGLSVSEIHKPWKYTSGYAKPIVEHEAARAAALHAYAIKKDGTHMM
jgi:deoxyribodipyrimidine photo-lyase